VRYRHFNGDDPESLGGFQTLTGNVMENRHNHPSMGAFSSLLRRFHWLAVALLPACSSEQAASTPGTPDGGATPDGSIASIFKVPESLSDLDEAAFYDHPWPSDVRLDADGTIHLAGLYNPQKNALVAAYIHSMKGVLHGFSPATGIYLRFTGPLDPATLPSDPRDTLDDGAAVQLLDVDPKSPEHGKRRLVQLHWRRDDGVFWMGSTLAIAPAFGYPLLPATRYAVVVTRKVRGEGGKAVVPAAELEEVLGQKPATERTAKTREVFGPALEEVERAGVARSDIVHLTTFTTNDPTAELFAAADVTHQSFAAPAASAWVAQEQTADYDVYEGQYGPSPDYQVGKPPFSQPADGGNFTFDAAGKPVVQREFNLRFSLVVPKAAKCRPPPAGYPIVIYAHGTGGNYRSLVNERGSVGQSLAGVCMASMGTDQIFHGTRPGAPPPGDPNAVGTISLAFFNLNNPAAARTNGRQSAIDLVQQARLFSDAHMTVPSATSRTGAAIAFDASKVLFFGHSQGGVNGPLFMAADGQARGGVLSGTAAMISVALLEKTEPSPGVAGAVKSILRLFAPEDEGELNLFHPIINLAQTIADATDPLHYMPRIIGRPREGLAPKSIFQTEGIAPDGTGDHYATPHGIEYASVAMGLPRMLPGVRKVEAAQYGEIADALVLPEGLSGNLAGGRASGVLAQFVPPAGTDGHFVVFNVPEARSQAARFCRNLADDPEGRVPAP